MTDQGMLFDELYSAYYNAVAEILKRASERPVTRQEVREIVEERAFSESILAIEPAAAVQLILKPVNPVHCIKIIPKPFFQRFI